MKLLQGVLVAGPGPLSADIVGSVPPLPTIANLDITAMCSMVSELSHGAALASDAAVQAALATRWFQVRAAKQGSVLFA